MQVEELIQRWFKFMNWDITRVIQKNIRYRYNKEYGYANYESYGSKSVNFDIYEPYDDHFIVIINNDENIKDVFKINCLRESFPKIEFNDNSYHVTIVPTNLETNYNYDTLITSLLPCKYRISPLYVMYPLIASDHLSAYVSNYKEIPDDKETYIRLKYDDPMGMVFNVSPGTNIEFEGIIYDVSPFKTLYRYTVI